MDSNSRAISDIDSYMPELRAALRAGRLATTIEIVEKIADLLEVLEDDPPDAGFECFRIAEKAWRVAAPTGDEFKFRKTYFLSRYPFMQKYDDPNKPISESSDNYTGEYSWRGRANKSHLTLFASELRKAEAEKIRSYALQIGLTRLIHYTPIENIPSIIENGILSVNQIRNRKLQHARNDAQRLDGLVDWISTSITHPNYAYLHAIRSREPNKRFAIIELNSNLLWTQDWIAFPTNAAATESKSLLLNNAKSLMGVSGLMNLFKCGESRDKSNPKRIERSTYNLPENEATDPQSEVMFLGEIPTTSIRKVHFELGKEYLGFTVPEIQRMVGKLPNVYEFESPHFFNLPIDYSWQQRRINPLTLDR